MSNVALGDMVHTKVDPRVNNGEDVAMAFVTRVKEVDGEERLNLRVLLDTGLDKRVTNVELVDSAPEEDDDVDKDVSGVQRVAWLP